MILGNEAGIEVVGEAADGNEAIEVYRRLRPAVVLMEIRMPGMDSVEAARAIMAETEAKVFGLRNRVPAVVYATKPASSSPSPAAQTDRGEQASERHPTATDRLRSSRHGPRRPDGAPVRQHRPPVAG